MTHAAALAVLEAWDKLAEAATPGPWYQGDDPRNEWMIFCADTEGSIEADRFATAAFIASFDPSVVRRITAAMRKILALHYRLSDDRTSWCGPCQHGYPCPSVSSIYAALGVTE
jgi:hypothetical protein